MHCVAMETNLFISIGLRLIFEMPPLMLISVQVLDLGLLGRQFCSACIILPGGDSHNPKLVSCVKITTCYESSTVFIKIFTKDLFILSIVR